MNEYGLKIGDVVWQMHGIRKGENIEWYAKPMCIEKMDEYKFLDAYNCGGSWNSIGKNYFLTRADAMKHWEEHKHEYSQPAVTSAMFHERKRLGEKVKDGITFWKGEDLFRVFVEKGLRGIDIVNPDVLPWKKCDEASEFGGPEEYITLRDIRDALGGHIITVWAEGPLHGEVYQTGNYPPETDWRLFGQLMGYA